MTSSKSDSETTTTAATMPEGTLFARKLRIERVLGRGAMGIVYSATDTLLDRRVALKVLTHELLNHVEQHRRFEREARAAASLKSEHATHIYEVGVEGHIPFLVMEYLEGRTLEAILQAEGPQPIAAVVGWMIEALDAIAEAHASGFVHRDIKPANLFLAERVGRAPIVKVLDFGLVKSLDPDLTQLTATGTTMGTPAYMAPEQVRAQADVDARADVWSIGMTLYELLTARLPFGSPSVSALLMNILKEKPLPLRDRRSDVPEALANVVTRCLRKDRAKRFASATDLLAALRAVEISDVPATPSTLTVTAEEAPATVRLPTPPPPPPPTPTPTPPPPSVVAPAPRTDRKKAPPASSSSSRTAVVFGGSAFGVVLVGGGLLAFAFHRAPSSPRDDHATLQTTAVTTDVSPPPNKEEDEEDDDNNKNNATDASHAARKAGRAALSDASRPMKMKTVAWFAVDPAQGGNDAWLTAMNAELGGCGKPVMPCGDAVVTFQNGDASAEDWFVVTIPPKIGCSKDARPSKCVFGVIQRHLPPPVMCKAGERCVWEIHVRYE